MFSTASRLTERQGRSGTTRLEYLQLNVLELFLDCLTEENARLVQLAWEGLCNATAGRGTAFPPFILSPAERVGALSGLFDRGEC
ncbi:unnamed protein product [Closterium sp. Naga37s-1]|nr:unnamed protein product [Closterium sp. Naga37s-1]